MVVGMHKCQEGMHKWWWGMHECWGGDTQMLGGQYVGAHLFPLQVRLARLGSSYWGAALPGGRSQHGDGGRVPLPIPVPSAAGAPGALAHPGPWVP